MRIANVYPYLATFTLAFFIRALPEILSGPYPVGYDLLAGYAPALWAFPCDSPMRVFGWAWSPFAIYILWFFWKLSNVNLYLFLKFASPIFYGLFVSSFYHMLLRGLGWSERKSFVTTIIFLLQPAVLRTSWDQLREELGFLFLFILLAKSKCDLISYARSRFPILLIFSLLIVFSHQLVSVLFLLTISWQFGKRLISGVRPSSRSLMAFIPSALIFIWQLYNQFIYPNFSDHIIPIQLPSGSNIPIFTNYFLSDPRFIEGDYWNVLAHVGSLSFYVVVPLIPFAIKGFFKDHVFTPILIWLCITSYSILIFPYFAFSYYWWWILLLPIPLTVYIGNSLEKWGVFVSSKQFMKAFAGFLFLGMVSISYACSAVRLGFPYAYTYMPSGLVESCVEFENISDLENAFRWVNENLPLNAMVIVPEKFQGFAIIHARSDFKIYVAPPLLRLSEVINYVRPVTNDVVYAVWYSKDIGKIDDVKVMTVIGDIGVYRLLLRYYHDLYF